MNWQEKAQELFGGAWISTLARLVGVNRRTMQRWASGQNETPQNVIDDVEATHQIWRGDDYIRF